MTYYERQKNAYDRNTCESIGDNAERFLKALEKVKLKLMKAEYETEKKRD